MTKEIGLLVEQSEVKSSSTATTANKKEGASLFDSLLKDASSEVTTDNTDSAEKKTKGESSVKADNSNKEKPETKNLEKSTSNSEKTPVKEEVKSQNLKEEPKSLLDRMVMEAKTTIENKDVAEVKVTKEVTPPAAAQTVADSSNALEGKDNLKQQNVLDNVQKISESSKNKDEIISKVTTKVEEKTALKNDTNILDEEIKTTETKIENKTDIKTENRPEVKDAAVKDSSINPAAVQKEPSLQQNSNKEPSLFDNLQKTAQTALNEVKTLEKSEPVVKTTEVEKLASSKDDLKPENLKSQNVLNNVQKISDSSKNKDEIIAKVTANVEDRLTSKETKVTAEPTTLKTETVVKNESLAKELASLNTNSKEEKVNISKESLQTDKTQIKEKETNSLLDRLINDAKKEVTASKDSSTLLNTKVQKDETVAPKSEVVSNIFLQNQQNKANNVSIAQTAVAKEVLTNATSIEDVKEGAKILELNAQKASVNVENSLEKQEVKESLKSNLLDRLAFNKNVVKVDLQNIATVLTQGMNSEGVNVVEEPVSLSVNPLLASSIQSRIIGARQNMGSMMSDIARQMAENYKPPVTAFRINLMPAHLGNIAITMKSDKDNGLTISLNMSNATTLEAMEESQATLRAALAKNFNEGMNFSLDFNMGEQNAQENQSNGSNKEQQHSSNEILETINNMAEDENEKLDYM